MCPRCDNGGSSSKTAEELVLAFLWYAANKACIRDVAGRFGLGETTAFRVIERVMEYLVELAKTEIAFPDDIRGLATDFEQLSGVPGVIGCIDGTYINIRCPAGKELESPAMMVLSDDRRHRKLREDQRPTPASRKTSTGAFNGPVTRRGCDQLLAVTPPPPPIPHKEASAPLTRTFPTWPTRSVMLHNWKGPSLRLSVRHRF
ncbi:hypothetical protein HPB50_029284 [Hyalomma asiaticum]|nr:hypothetical protein HPB50_029284 [Hyalomma asiaticum]